MPLQQDYDEVDVLMDEAHARRTQIDGELADLASKYGAGNIPRDVAHRATSLRAEGQRLDHAINGLINSPNAPAGYAQHYNQKYMTAKTEAAPAEPEGPGLIDKLFTGAKDTAKYAIQHPGSAFRHATQGAAEFLSLPFRAVEGAVDADIPVVHARKRMESLQKSNAAKDAKEGIDPRGTGPIVAENMGQIAVPLPLPLRGTSKLLSKETAKNVGVGAGFGATANVLERVAHDETVDDESLMTSAGVGGALSALLGRFFKKPAPGTGDVGSTGSSGAANPNPSRPASAAGRRDEIDPSFVRGYSTPEPKGAGRLLEGPKEVPGATTGPPKTPTPSAGPVAPTPMETLMRKEKPAPTSPLGEAVRGIEAEKAAQTQAPVKQPDAIIAPGEKIPKTKLVDQIKPDKMGEALKSAEDEVLLGKVARGETKVKDVPVNRKKGEAPATAVEGEVGATKPKPSEVIDFFGEGKPKPAAKPSAINPAVRNVEQPQPAKPAAEQIKLEKWLADNGYQIQEKEPFPGEKSYNVIDPKTGNTVARGDREQILNAMNVRNEGKGFKLTSGVDPTDLADMLKKKLGIMPEGVNVENSPHREGPINMALRSAGLETPRFAMRHNKAGKDIVDTALDFEDLKQTRFNDLFHEPQPTGGYKDTRLYDYFGSSAADKQRVNDALVLGDKLGRTFTAEELKRQGYSDAQVSHYEGVREGLDKVKAWIKEIGGHEEFDPKIEGYIPRVWSGDLEIFVNGSKHVPTKDGRELGSSFNTLRDAAETVWKLKQENPTAKIDVKFFSDPNYLMQRGLTDARAVARAKANVEGIGKLSPAEIEEAFKISKGAKDFAKHLMERKDAKGYETEELDRILYSYFNQAAKTVESKRMRTAVEKIMKDHGNELTGSQVKYLNSYVDRVAGKPAWDQMAINTFVRETPLGKWIDPVKAGGAIKTARDWITYKSLGFGNVSWALVNIDSLTRHVWPMLQKEAGKNADTFATEKYLGAAIKSFFGDKALKQKLAHNGVIDIQMMSEHRPQIGAHFGKGQITPQQVIMYLGIQTEEFVRGVAAIARYKMALDQGYAEMEAMRRASRFVGDTVGRYSKAGKPPAFTGGIGSTVGMFKTYPVVMLENMFKAFESKDLGVISRYMLAALGAGGVIGAIPGSEEVDKLATKTLGKSPIQWGNDNLGEGVMTGLASLGPGASAVDLSRKAGLPDVFPNSTKDWLGPVWNTYAQTIADLLNGEYKEAAKDLVPTSLRNALSVSQAPGKVIGRYDKPVVELAPGTPARVMRGLGFQSPAEVRALRDYEYLETLSDSRETELQKLTRRLSRGNPSDQDLERFHELGGSNRRLKAEANRQSLTLRQRQEKQLPRLLRHQRPSSE